jgi:hypothetical protein
MRIGRTGGHWQQPSAGRTCLDCSSNVPCEPCLRRLLKLLYGTYAGKVTIDHAHVGTSVRPAVEVPVTFHVGTPSRRADRGQDVFSLLLSSLRTQKRVGRAKCGEVPVLWVPDCWRGTKRKEEKRKEKIGISRPAKASLSVSQPCQSEDTTWYFYRDLLPLGRARWTLHAARMRDAADPTRR